MTLDDNLINIFSDKKIPTTGLFELTYNCNLKCQHCCVVPAFGDNNEGGKELSLEEVKSILDQLVEMKTFVLVFSGGEALMRPDIFDILAYAHQLSFRINLYTNGTLIDSKAADELRKIRIHNIGISLYGATEETHDRVTGVSGSYKATVEAIHLLNDRGLNITLKSAIMQTNFHELDGLHNWSKKHNIFHEFSSTILPLLNGSRENLRLRLTDEQCRIFLRKPWVYELFHKTIEEDKPAQSKKKSEQICPAGVTSFNISPYGDVYPCVYLRLYSGNLREMDFSEAWNSPEMKKMRSARFDDLRVCSTCELYEKWCGICPGHSWLEHGDWLEPASEVCRTARLRREVYENQPKAYT